MRAELLTGYFPALHRVPNVPGGTPVPVRSTAPPPSSTTSKSASLAPVPGADGHGSVPRPRHWVADLLEDALLLPVIVFMVPVVILLLAAPFAVVLALAAKVAERW